MIPQSPLLIQSQLRATRLLGSRSTALQDEASSGPVRKGWRPIPRLDFKFIFEMKVEKKLGSLSICTSSLYHVASMQRKKRVVSEEPRERG